MRMWPVYLLGRIEIEYSIQLMIQSGQLVAELELPYSAINEVDRKFSEISRLVCRSKML
jgi:hypothetical protein